MWYLRLVETNRLPDWLIRAVLRGRQLLIATSM